MLTQYTVLERDSRRERVCSLPVLCSLGVLLQELRLPQGQASAVYGDQSLLAPNSLLAILSVPVS